MAHPDTPASAELVYDPPAWLAGIPVITDMTDLEEAAIARIMAATTPEMLLANPESVGLREHVGECFTFHRIQGLLPSAIREGEWYGLIEASTDDGEIVSVTTGSLYALGRLVKAQNEGWLPRRMRVVELESASHPGQASLWVVDAPRGFSGDTDATPL